MNNDTTIPSQLGPADTMPSQLGPAERTPRMRRPEPASTLPRYLWLVILVVSVYVVAQFLEI